MILLLYPMIKAITTLAKHSLYLHVNLFTHHIIPVSGTNNKVDKCNFMVPACDMKRFPNFMPIQLNTTKYSCELFFSSFF